MTPGAPLESNGSQLGSPAFAGLSEPDRVRLAIHEYYSREARHTYPAGTWQDRLWQPAPLERQACCDKVLPTEDNRQALEAHCRTLAHIASRYGVSSTALRAALHDGRKRKRSSSLRPPSTLPETRSGRYVAALQETACREVFELLHEELAQSLPLLQRLRSLCGLDGAQEELVPLLALASVNAERLLAAIRLAYSSETSMAYAVTLLETLRKPLPEQVQEAGVGATGRVQVIQRSRPIIADEGS